MGGIKKNPPVGTRAYWTNKHHGRIVQVTPGRNGQPVYHREVTAPCTRCKQDHTFVMTSKPKLYCEACVSIIADEKRKREKERSLAARLARAGAPPEPKPRKLIPYAGHPRSGYDE